MGPLLSTRLASSALPMADGARCFYAYYLCGELVKTAPADTMISNRQSINAPASSLSPLVVSSGGAAVAYPGDVSFPVIFVLFRCVPELNIFLGIMRFSCVILIAYL